MILRNHAEKKEAARQKKDPDYKSVIDLLGKGSLKDPSLVHNYVNEYNNNRALIVKKMIDFDNSRGTVSTY